MWTYVPKSESFLIHEALFHNKDEETKQRKKKAEKTNWIFEMAPEIGKNILYIDRIWDEKKVAHDLTYGNF